MVSVERLRRQRTWFVVGGCWFLLLALVSWIRDGFTRSPGFILGAAVVLVGLAIWMHHRAAVTDRPSSGRRTRQSDIE